MSHPKAQLMEQTPGQRSIPELIARARSGDPAARERLFECCRNYIAIIARTKVETWMRAKFDGSDLVQQTMLEAYQAFDQFEGQTEEEWLVWLKRILTHNTQDAIRHFRTSKRDAGRERSSASTSSSDSDVRSPEPELDLPTPSRIMMRQEEDLALANAIAQLIPDHQEVINLRSLQRLPFDEVAVRMGRTRPAVQMLWMRAIKRLESLLSQE